MDKQPGDKDSEDARNVEQGPRRNKKESIDNEKRNNEIKNILEGTKSRITEAEDSISEVEDRMVEISETERKKEKLTKRNEDKLRDLWDNVKRPKIRITGVTEEEDKKKDHEKILEIIVENFPKMGKEIVIQLQETQRVLKQDKPKVKHHETHINQINKDQTQKTHIKRSKGKARNNTQGDSHKDNS